MRPPSVLANCPLGAILQVRIVGEVPCRAQSHAHPMHLALPSSTMRSLLLVEDDAGFARSVCRVLDARGWQTTHVTSAAAALGANGAFSLAAVDLGLPDRSGIDLIASLTARGLRALAFTVFDGKAQVEGAIRAGAVGYLLKGEPLERVLTQLDECMDGGTPVSSRVARHLFEALRPRGPQPQLTGREDEVLVCLMRGDSYQRCADVLGIGIGTVQTHVKNLYRKLDVSSRSEAIAWATKHKP